MIKIADGTYAYYAHLQKGSKGVQVEPGERVEKGQVIGKLGNTGNTDAPHLHFMLIDGKAPLTSSCAALRDRLVPHQGRHDQLRRLPGWRCRRRSPPSSEASNATDCRCTAPSTTSAEEDVTAAGTPGQAGARTVTVLATCPNKKRSSTSTASTITPSLRTSPATASGFSRAAEGKVGREEWIGAPTSNPAYWTPTCG